jgi:hypothetical protein
MMPVATIVAVFLENIPDVFRNIKFSVVAQIVNRKDCQQKQHPSMLDGRRVNSYVLYSFSTSVQNEIVKQNCLRSKNKHV